MIASEQSARSADKKRLSEFLLCFFLVLTLQNDTRGRCTSLLTPWATENE